MDDLILDFINESEDSLVKVYANLLALEEDHNNENAIKEIFRIFHTIKGTCGFLGFSVLEKITHEGENVLNKIRERSLEVNTEIITCIFKTVDTVKEILETIKETGIEPTHDYSILLSNLDAILNGKLITAQTFVDNSVEKEIPMASNDDAPKEVAAKDESNQSKKTADKKNNESIRIKISLLDELMQKVSELVLARNQLMQIARHSNIGNSPLFIIIQRINALISSLQERIIKTRMQPIGSIWGNYSRVVRDIGIELGKKIKLEMSGEDTEIDRNLIDSIKDPLTHMIRNSADHGIESPQDRIAQGKDPEGTVSLKAYHQAGQVVISVSDNGRGLNTTKIKEKIVKQNLLSQDLVDSLNDQQIYQYIFHPGFSTADKVSSVSGRGVGMDVVKSNVENIGGHIELKSKEGFGSEFIMKIPLTLAIMPVLIIMTEGQKYAIPLIHVHELIRVTNNSEHQIQYLGSSPILKIRGKVIPLIIASEMLQYDTQEQKDKQFIVICKLASEIFGIVVDKIFDIEEIVVKPTSSVLKSISLYSGCTILGDGSVIMIFDTMALVEKVRKDLHALHYCQSEELSTETAEVLNFEKSKFLLFKPHPDKQIINALPLDYITRLEEGESHKIESLSGKYLMQYRDRLMRVKVFDPEFDFLSRELFDIAVFSNSGEIFGLVVGEIIDVVEHTFDSKVMASEDPKYLSTIVINGRSVEIVDITYFYEPNRSDDLETGVCGAKRSIKLAKGSNILLVDDSPFFRKFIPPIIAAKGYKISTAESVERAIEILQSSNKIDAVITDLQMPGMSGSDLLDFVRSQDNLKDIPIIALSSFNKEEADEKGQNVCDFDAYIPKTHQNKLVEILEGMVA